PALLLVPGPRSGMPGRISRCLTGRRRAGLPHRIFIPGRTPGEKRLQPALKRPARQQHLPLALVAAKPNVRPQADNGPVKITTRVRLPQPDHVPQPELDRGAGFWLPGARRQLAHDPGRTYINPGIFMPPVSAPIFSSAVAEARVMASWIAAVIRSSSISTSSGSTALGSILMP